MMGPMNTLERTPLGDNTSWVTLNGDDDCDYFYIESGVIGGDNSVNLTEEEATDLAHYILDELE